MSDFQRTAPEPYEWGVQWDDGVIAYASEEIARHEWQYPTRPNHVNPRIVRREVGPWVPVYQSSSPGHFGQISRQVMESRGDNPPVLPGGDA